VSIDKKLTEKLLSAVSKRYHEAQAHVRKNGQGNVDFPAIVGQVLDEHNIKKGIERENYFRELCRRGGRAGAKARKTQAASKKEFLSYLKYFESEEYIRDIAELRVPDDGEPGGLTHVRAREILEREILENNKNGEDT